MKTLNRIISNYMQIITLIMVAIILVLMVGFQVVNERQRTYEIAVRTFDQMEQILEENNKELEEEKEAYSQDCLQNAEEIAYIIEEDQTILDSVERLKEVAELVGVDEIHIFDETGRIFTGTNPEYFNYTFDSGEQMRFFKAMLTDKSLKLVQDITPNTAESKLMQYSAIWSSNGNFIVQVGMEPVNVMNATQKNELSHIFSLLRVNPDTTYYAVDAKSGEIKGSTDVDVVGQNITDLGIEMEKAQEREKGFISEVSGINSYCVFRQIGTEYVGYVISVKVMFQRIPLTTLVMALALLFIAYILRRAVERCMKNYFVDGIQSVNAKLSRITDGEHEETVDIRDSVEFFELSNYINKMVKSLLNNDKRMSYVLNKTNMYIGVYECGGSQKRVRFTEHLPQVFGLSESRMAQLAADGGVFESYIQSIKENPFEDEKGIFCLNTIPQRYVKLDEVSQNGEKFGVAIDVTEEITTRKKIETERDMDQMTGLLNRWGMEKQLAVLFEDPSRLKHSAIVMLDADGLKKINDTYGHEKGDLYLQTIARVIEVIGTKEQITVRHGGDEFVLFLYGYENQEELFLDIEKLQQIRQHASAQLNEELSVPICFSFGYCLCDNKTEYRNMLAEADQAMYEDKRRRKN